MYRLLCFLGWHDWLLNHPNIELGTIRTCRRCGRKESASYDMAYGCTIWDLV